MKAMLPVLLATLLAIALGGAHGYAIIDFARKSGEKIEPVEAPVKAEFVTKELKPIVTNLAAPPGAWVRLEASVVVDPKANLDEKVMGDLTTDLVSFLRSVNASQIEGVLGLRRLRDDMNERLMLRSNGRVKEILIQTLVVQ